jgi:hypothetical protein
VPAHFGDVDTEAPFEPIDDAALLKLTTLDRRTISGKLAIALPS